MQTPTKEDVARDVARDYIQKTKGWQDNQFQIQVLGPKGPDVIAVDAVHADDLRDEKGSNKSVQLDVDTAKKTVIRELAYQ